MSTFFKANMQPTYQVRRVTVFDPRRVLLPLLLLATAPATSCTPVSGDRATAPDNEARAIATLRFSVASTAVSRTALITGFYQPAGGVAAVALRRDTLALTPGVATLPFSVELATCLADASIASSGGGACPLRIAIALRDDAGVLLDSTTLGPFTVRPGASISPPAVAFAVPSDISLALPNPLRAGDTVAVQAIVRDSGGTSLSGRPVSFTSSDPTIASIDAACRLVGLRPGDVTITARSLSAQIAVARRVTPPVAGVCGGRPAVLRSGDITGAVRWDSLDGPSIIPAGAVIVVRPAGTLTIAPGTQLCMARARMFVSGALVAEGTTQSPIEIRGSRAVTVGDPQSFVRVEGVGASARIAHARVDSLDLLEIQNNAQLLDLRDTRLRWLGSVVSSSFQALIRVDSVELVASGGGVPGQPRPAVALNEAQFDVSRLRVESPIGGGIVVGRNDTLGASTAPAGTRRLRDVVVAGGAGPSLFTNLLTAFELGNLTLTPSSGRPLVIRSSPTVTRSGAIALASPTRTKLEIGVDAFAQLFPDSASQAGLALSSLDTVIFFAGTVQRPVSFPNQPVLLARTGFTVLGLGAVSLRPATRLQLGPSSVLQVQLGGRLIARGTAAAPVRITPIAGLASWQRLVFSGTSVGSSLVNVDVVGGGDAVSAYSIQHGAGHPLALDSVRLLSANVNALVTGAGGTSPIPDPLGNSLRIERTLVTGGGGGIVIFKGSSPLIRDLTIRDTPGGFYIQGGDIANVTVRGVSGPIAMWVDSAVVGTQISRINTFGHAATALLVFAADSLPVLNSWWGSAGGPFGPGGGGLVGLVRFVPFATAPVPVAVPRDTTISPSFSAWTRLQSLSASPPRRPPLPASVPSPARSP